MTPHDFPVIDIDENGDMIDPDDPHARSVPKNPALLGFPPMLPFELAMREDTPAKICEAYKITKAEFADMIENPVFQKAYADAQEGLRKEGMSFRIKAQLQAEELLKISWGMIHSNLTPAAIRARMIENTVRWSGYEPKTNETAGGIANGGGFSINIVMANTANAANATVVS